MFYFYPVWARQGPSQVWLCAGQGLTGKPDDEEKVGSEGHSLHGDGVYTLKRSHHPGTPINERAEASRPIRGKLLSSVKDWRGLCNVKFLFGYIPSKVSQSTQSLGSDCWWCKSPVMFLERLLQIQFVPEEILLKEKEKKEYVSEGKWNYGWDLILTLIEHLICQGR